MTERERSDIKFEIVERIGVLNSYPTGWSKEINIVRWNDKQEKYDIRDWSPGHDRMSRGVTMHSGEVKKLIEICSDHFKDEPASEPPAENNQSDTGAAAEVPF